MLHVCCLVTMSCEVRGNCADSFCSALGFFVFGCCVKIVYKEFFFLYSVLLIARIDRLTGYITNIGIKLSKADVMVYLLAKYWTDACIVCTVKTALFYVFSLNVEQTFFHLSSLSMFYSLSIVLISITFE